MKISRPSHPDFQFFLDLKDQKLIELFTDLREFILKLYPYCNELIHHIHAFTTLTRPRLSGKLTHERQGC